MYKSIVQPTYALIQPAANFNLATVRAHVLDPLHPTQNYHNNTKVKNEKNNFCNIANHYCDKRHAQLLRFAIDKICAVCVGRSQNGNIVQLQAMKLLEREGTREYHVYDFKDSYLSIFEEYKKTRVAVSLDCNFFNLILLAAMLALHVLFDNNSKYSQGGRETYTYINGGHFLDWQFQICHVMSNIYILKDSYQYMHF